MNLLFLFSWFCFFLLAAASGSHRDKIRYVSTSASNSYVAFSGKFRPEFFALVLEAVHKRFDEIITLPEPSFKHNPLEVSIRSTFLRCQSKMGDLPWDKVLCDECSRLEIFGSAPFEINEIIPIAFSRILRAEVVDINKLLTRTPAKDWTHNSANVNHVFSKILDMTVRLKDEEIIPAVLWLVLCYHEKFPGKRGVLLERGEEELKVMNVLYKKEELLAFKTPSRELPDTLDVKEVPALEPAEESNVQVIGDTHKSDFENYTRNNNNMLSTTDKKFNFESDFKELVLEAINKNLDEIVTSNRKLAPMEFSIRETFRFLKCKDKRLPWGRVLQNECRRRNIFGSILNINEIIPIALSRILKAEGADINKVLLRAPAKH